MKKSLISLFLVLALLATAVDAVGASESVILHFNKANGGFPVSPLTADSNGNFYGTTGSGGSGCNYGCGLVYELSPGPGSSWKEQVLYVFTGQADGSGPDTNLLMDSKGNLYGGVEEGAANGSGGIFRLSPGSNGTWTETVLYSFTRTDGYDLGTQLAADNKGNIYGTLRFGGFMADGSIFELSPQSNGTWLESTLYTFSGNGDGSSPFGGVVPDSQGNLYGTTAGGGTFNNGTVYELSNSKTGWTKTILYDFQNKGDGAFPESPLTIDADGNLYGSAELVFELSLSNGIWTEKVLDPNEDPPGGVVFDAASNLYGANAFGGNGCNNPGCGSVFVLAPQPGGTWKATTLHNFESASDGSQGYARPLIDNTGKRLFGTTEYGGGRLGWGTVYIIQK